MKTFRSILTEAAALNDGVVLTPRKSHDGTFYHKGEIKKQKVFDVHLHGEHIGSVEQHSHKPNKKISGSRLVKPMAERVAWTGRTNSATSDKHGAGFYRSSDNYGRAHPHEAANHLARHYAPHIKKKD